MFRQRTEDISLGRIYDSLSCVPKSIFELTDMSKDSMKYVCGSYNWYNLRRFVAQPTGDFFVV